MLRNMTPAKPKKPDEVGAPDVELHDEVYFRHATGPKVGKVISRGRDGCHVECDGERHKMPWGHFLGHKRKGVQNARVVDHGEDGLLVENEHGHRRFIRDPMKDREEEEREEGPMSKAMPAVLFFGKAEEMAKAMRPGLTQKKITDKRGVQTTRWVNPNKKKGGGGRDGGGEEPPEAGAAHGFGTHNLEHGDTVSFKIGSLEGKGVIGEPGKHGVRVRDDSGHIHHVRWDQVTGHHPGGKAPEAKPEAEGDGQAAPEKDSKGKLEGLMADARKKAADRKQVAGTLARNGGSVRLEHEDGRHAIAGPDMSKPGTHRLTHFDANGPVGHTEHESLEDAVHEGLRAHFKPSSKPIVADPKKFGAADYASKHDDPNVTPESIIGGFPPDTSEKIAAAEQRLKGIEETIKTHKAGGEYSDERQRLHNQILYEGLTKKVLDEKTGQLVEKHFPGILSDEARARAKPADGEAPTFTILGGRGGSGKSWFDGQVYDPKKAIVLDADHIKGLLPEYEGWNAAQVHEESGELFDRITEEARALGLHIVHDATMKTAPKAAALVQSFKDHGYRVEAHYMHLPRQEAAKRAVGRFLGKTGRYVPVNVVLGMRTNEDSFDKVKPLVDAWSFRDNNVPQGHPPILVAESKGKAKR